MAYQALYRKWRPQTFEEVLGQTATVRTLRRQIQTGRIAHAYLFCGCRGTGKTTMAKLMSRAINCLNPRNGDPCCECEVCRAIQSETTLDVVEYDAASNSRVEEIREILGQVPYPPQLAKYKVYIIDEVHMLSASAFNALLKTLEEPPSHIVFILATTEPQKLPATILSRVQRYDFGRIPISLMVERMKEALADMNITAEDEALHMVAAAAEGAMRDAFSILDMCVAGAEGGTITAEAVRDILGTSDKSFLFSFFDAIAHRDESAVMHRIDELIRSGRDPQTFLRELSGHTRSLLTVKVTGDEVVDLLDISPEDAARLREQAEAFSSERLLRMMDLFARAESDLRYSATPRIGLESAVLHACEQRVEEDSTALAERIGELEAQVQLLQQQLQKGVVVARAPASAPAEPAAKVTGKPAPKAPPADQPVAALWEQAKQSLKKDQPALYSVIAKLRFKGEEGDTLRILIPKETEVMFYKRWASAKVRAAVEEALSAQAGRTMHIQPVNENPEAVRDSADADAQKVFDVFGRENVQLVDE